VFQYHAYSEPNPHAYPIEGTPYGATTAYPNLYPDQLADELKLGRGWGLTPVEVGEDIPAEVVRQAVNAVPDRNWIYVVLVDGRMFIIPYMRHGQPTTHTMANRGADVIAAGHVLFDSAGNVVGWNGQSGHYWPDERQSKEVAEAIFTLANLRAS
jgi:hypothetical protein